MKTTKTETETVNKVDTQEDTQAPPMRKDSWGNLLTKHGDPRRDKRMASFIQAPPKFSENDLTNIYQGSDLGQRIARIFPYEMTREGFKILPKNEKDIEAIEAVMHLFNERGIGQKVREAMIWSRLYGTSLMFLGVAGTGRQIQPLDLDKARELKFVTLANRYDVTIDQYYQDPTNPMYGQPRYYKFNTSGNNGAEGRKIHESRIIRFDGVLTPEKALKRNEGWADSVFTSIYPVLRAYDGTWDVVEILMQDFSQAVFKMKNLAKMMAAHGEAEVEARMEIIDISRSVLRSIIIDADNEEFDRKMTPLLGLPELLHEFKARVASAAEIPIPLLFGQQQGGLSNNGEADLQNWADNIRARQEAQLRKPLELLIQLLLKEVPGGRAIKFSDWKLEFNSLYQLDAVEEAGRRKIIAETDAIYFNMGAVTLEEIASSRFGGESFNSETHVDMTVPREEKKPDPVVMAAPEPQLDS